MHASVQIYATGTAGNGSAATPLLSKPVKTDDAGNFTMSGVRPCPSATSEVYMVSTGGSPAQLGTENSDATLMTLLGSCSKLASSTSIHLNEVTTIASVYAVAPYLSGPGAIGSSAEDAQALADAVNMASELANLDTASSPGLVPAGEAAPTDKLYTLANLINSCVDSRGGSAGDGSPCGNLFQYAGESTISPSRDTMSAVLAIAKAPTVNVDMLYQLVPARGVFDPVLNSAPVDWRLQLVPTPPAPTYSPEPGAYTTAQTVTLSDGDASAAIFYTTDGTTPTAASTRYTDGILVQASTAIRAVAIDEGLSSAISAGDFNLTTSLAAPVFSPAPGTFTSVQSVTISDNDLSAKLFYTTDGGIPSASSIRYSGVISLSASATIRSIAIAGSLSSVVASAAYTITPPPVPFFSPVPGSYSSSQSVNLSDSDVSATIYYSTDGSTPSTSSLQYVAPIAVSNSETIRTIAVHGTLASGVATGSYDIAAADASQPATISYYVSNSGKDSNPGTTASAPWKTVARVNKAKLAPGSQVLFESRSVWHEQLTAQSGVTYGHYGPAADCSLSSTLVATCSNMPVIDGADVVNGWSYAGNSTFRAAYSGPVSKAFVDSIYEQTTPLVLVSDQGKLSGTPGSVYGDGQNVYVHLADGSNPASHTIEVSGARSYGVLVGGAEHVTITGLEIIRTAKSGYLNYSFGGTGASNVIENSVLFNTGDSLPDQNMGGPIEGAILSVGGRMQAPVSGFSAVNNWVGQMDVPHDTLNYSWAGIQVDGMAGAQVTKNKIATVNGWGIRVQDFFNNSCTAPVISSNEMVNSEGNIAVSGCTGAVVDHNAAHDSFGNGLESGAGLRPTICRLGYMWVTTILNICDQPTKISFTTVLILILWRKEPPSEIIARTWHLHA